MNPSLTTLVDLLSRRSAEQSDSILYRFLSTGDVDGTTVDLTFGELDAQARAIGAWLQARGAAGERVVLLHEQGLDFIKAFFGCLYAGAIAVPAFPPSVARFTQTLSRLRSIVADCGARFIFTTSDITRFADQLTAEVPQLGEVAWVATDEIDGGLGADWRPPAIDGDSLAVLQYTSGSTGVPKGVMLTHGNLLHNSAQICEAYRHDSSSTMVSWQPFYHDMGLIGGVIQPLYFGGQVILMSPEAFIERPARWLEAVSAFGATTSGAPNFAYELCARRTTDTERAGLDLSSWRVAFTGAERIQADTLDRFSRAFAPYGFRSEAWYPCYGLAEATLFVTGVSVGQGAPIRRVPVSTLQRAGVADGATRDVVSCGHTRLGQEVVIVDPETGLACGPDEVGEIWTRGASVARGYWNRPEETEQTFGAHLADTGDGPFLRTGDLGLLHDGGLDIVGRVKDVIILRGRNYYPEDIEKTVAESHPAVRAGCAAAFSVDTFGDESAVVVVEVKPVADVDPDDVVHAIRQTVAVEHGVELAAVALIKPRTLGKTTSGKIQRRASRAAWLAGRLKLVHDWRRASAQPQPVAAPVIANAAVTPIGEEEIAGMLATLIEIMERTCQVLLRDGINGDTPLPSLGLDSLNMAELTAALAERLGVDVSLDLVKDGPTLGELAGRLLRLRETAMSAPAYSGENFDLADAIDGTSQLPFAERISRAADVMDRIGFSTRFRREIVSPTDRGVMVRDGSTGEVQTMLMFGSNSYLGLATSPTVAKRVGELLFEGAVGLGGAPLLSGYTKWHRELEERIAQLKGTEAAMVFSSGYQANVGVVSAVCRGSRSIVIHDEYVHASFRDGLKLAGVRTAAFRHNDTHHLEELLARHASADTDVFVGIEGLYSMDGDLPALDTMVELCERFGAVLMLDDAHATGVIGATGSGSPERFGVKGRVPIITGTLSKALAGVGGFVCGSHRLIQYLRLVSRAYMFSTSMPPIVAAQALGGLDAIDREPGRLQALRRNIKLACDGFRRIGLVGDEIDPESPILAILTPQGMDIAAAADQFEDLGIFVNTVEYPAVPLDQQRFRVSIMSSHVEQDIEHLVRCFAKVWGELGFPVRSADQMITEME